MQCPKCGNENPDDAQLCLYCGFNLTKPDAQQPKQNAKISILVLVAVLLAGLSAILVSFVKPTLAFLAAVFSFCSAIAAIAKFLRSKKKAKRTTIAIGIVVLIFSSLQMLILTYWRIDAAPIPNDYTINDIRSAAPEYNQTYELLLSIVDKNDSSPREYSIGFSEEDLNNLLEIHDIFKENDLQVISQRIKEKEQDIITLWDKSKKGRDILVKLDSFSEIADLSEPKFEIRYPKNLRDLMFLYQGYICLQSINGNHEQAFHELTMLDSIFKKASINARSIVMKYICYACFEMEYNLFNFMINNPITPNETLSVIKDRIDFLSDEHTSLRNALIFEYLTMKNELEKMSNEPKLKYSPFSPLKYNSSLRLFRNYFDEWIADDENRKIDSKLRIWPSVYPNMPVEINEIGKLDSLYYRIYNPVGYALIELVVPAIDKATLTKTRILIYSDLLKVVLNARLGEEVDLKARTYGEKYIIDIENKIIFSPGPDGKPGTNDDIKLPINPKVLDLRN